MTKPSLNSLKRFFFGNIVCFVALLAAIITCFFVKPDKEYLSYIDLRTICCLLCMMAVIGALRNVDFFRILAGKIIKTFKNTRSAILALVFVTYFGSMLIANDMALITFLPLGYLVLTSADKKRYMAFTFIMQNIAANLGGMLTPFGNPQNLFLYNYFNIPTSEFFKIMYIPFLAAFALILTCCLFVKKEPLEQTGGTPSKLADRTTVIKTVAYLIMFLYSIIIVFRVVPYWSGLIMLPVIVVLDRKTLLQVDYMLLLTFIFFFIFAGNMARIDAVKSFLSELIGKNTLLTAALACQLISNVPSAILLSSFTTNYKALLMAVNVGGCGTLISSLASLITFRQYTYAQPTEKGCYLLLFHAFNFGFLAVLIGVCYGALSIA